MRLRRIREGGSAGVDVVARARGGRIASASAPERGSPRAPERSGDGAEAKAGGASGRGERERVVNSAEAEAARAASEARDEPGASGASSSPVDPDADGIVATSWETSSDPGACGVGESAGFAGAGEEGTASVRSPPVEGAPADDLSESALVSHDGLGGSNRSSEPSGSKNSSSEESSSESPSVASSSRDMPAPEGVAIVDET